MAKLPPMTQHELETHYLYRYEKRHLRRMARGLRIRNSANMTKEELIQEIYQRTEGPIE